MFDTDMMSALATRRGETLDQLLARRALIESQRDAAPDIEYRNNVLYQDGQRATPEQIAAFAKTNPYVSQNWLATPEDRGGRIPGEMPATESVPQGTMTESQRNALSTQYDFFGRPLGPMVRSGDSPPKGVAVEKVSIEAIPTGKTPIPYNAAAGVKPLMNSILGILGSLGGPVSRTAKSRTTK